MSDDLERVLRRALAAEAESVEPAGDGLRRIRARTRRPARTRWRVPALALAGTAALIAAVFMVPAALRSPDPAPTAAGSAAAGPTPAPTETLIPGAGVVDLVTVWPYRSRAEGYARAERDVEAGTYPDLTQPDLAAVTFVGSYVGTSPALAAESLGRWKAGLRMRVTRGDTVVSVVYLVRVRVGNDAPYVVVDATAPGLTVTARPGAAGTVTAGGTRGDATAVPYVQLRVPGVAEPLVAVRATVAGTRWSAELVPPGASRSRARTDAVAAWTLDDAGRVTAFAADPAGP